MIHNSLHTLRRPKTKQVYNETAKVCAPIWFDDNVHMPTTATTTTTTSTTVETFKKCQSLLSYVILIKKGPKILNCFGYRKADNLRM